MSIRSGGPKLTPRDPELQSSMSQIAPVITKETTMWRAWVGFNASHSVGAILFGLVFGFLAFGSLQTPLSVSVPARCRAGNAWWFCCAWEGLLVQCAFHRHLHFFGLLRRPHCAIAGVTMHSSRSPALLARNRRYTHNPIGSCPGEALSGGIAGVIAVYNNLARFVGLNDLCNL